MKRSIIYSSMVLIALPLVYFIYSLSPWAKELFIRGNSNLFIPFWTGIIAMHWISVLLVKVFLKKEGKTFRNIGYGLNCKQTIVFITSYLALALLAWGFTEWSLNYVSLDAAKLAKLSNFFPKTTAHRALFIATVFSAGFCEEIVYRGYAITKLRDLGLNKWLAIIPAAIAFVLTHGIVAVSSYGQFLFYFAFALLFGLIFVLSKRLLPNMIIHMLFDLMAMMAIFQAIGN